jgi:hypothetical protein
MEGLYKMLLLCGAGNNSTPLFYCLMAQLMWGSVCFTFGVKNGRECNIFLVLGLEVFRVSKGTLC